MKWFICHNHLLWIPGQFYVLPHIDLWYYKDYFLETGVYTPAFGFEIGWLKWKWALGVQQGY
jgi:hypothetical protein